MLQLLIKESLRFSPLIIEEFQNVSRALMCSIVFNSTFSRVCRYSIKHSSLRQGYCSILNRGDDIDLYMFYADDFDTLILSIIKKSLKSSNQNRNIQSFH